VKNLFIGILLIAITFSCKKTEIDIIENSIKAFKTGLNLDTINFNDQSRHFKFYIPDNLSDNASLLFRFHGSRNPLPDYATNVEPGPLRGLKEDYVLNKIAETENIIVVYPAARLNGATFNWTEKDANLEFFDEMLNYFQNQFSNIDFNKVYVCGHSSGAIFSFVLAGNRANVIAAAVPVSGQYKLISGNNDSFTLDNISTPIRAYNGVLDTRANYDAAYANFTIWVALENKGNPESIENSNFNIDTYNVTRTRWLGGFSDMEMYSFGNVGHSFSWDIIAESMWDFMKSHKKE